MRARVLGALAGAGASLAGVMVLGVVVAVPAVCGAFTGVWASSASALVAAVVSGSGSVPSASRAESRCARGRGVSLAGHFHSIFSAHFGHRQSRSEIGECNGDSNMGASYNKREL